MRKYLFLFLCACFTLSIVANDRVITRAQLRSAKKESVSAGKLVTSTGGDASVALHRIIQERGLNLNDNKLNKSASLRETLDDVMGEKIVMVDTYDFDWDSVACVAAVVDTSYFMKGKMSELTHQSSSTSQYLSDDVYIADFYDTYHIPVEVDYSSGAVVLMAGVPLVTLSGIYEESSGGIWESYRGSSDNYVLVTRRLYAMPESWLAGAEDYSDIYGYITSDGSISLEGGFGFLIEQEETEVHAGVPRPTEVSWGLSPIFRNFHMFTPNAVHEYRGSGSGSGPGGSDVNFVEMVSLINGPQSTTGGVVHRPINPRPVKPKPVNPRPFNNNTMTLCVNGGDNSDAEPERDAEQDRGKSLSRWPQVTTAQPVYLYQQDDSTLLVYNLYGKDYSWNYMIKRPDGSVLFPSQKVGYNTTKNEPIYNCSFDSDTIVLDNVGSMVADTIRWNNTYFFGESGMQGYHYSNNKLYLTGESLYGFLPAPVFVTPVMTDSTVVFTATSSRSDATVYIYEFEPADYAFVGEGEGNYMVIRGDTPRTVCLYAIAEAMVGDTYLFSDYVELDYEVPAFFIPGDVNGDRIVGIADVTTFIDHLLSEDFESSDDFHAAEADFNRDGIWSVADLTDLIDLLLSRQ